MKVLIYLSICVLVTAVCGKVINQPKPETIPVETPVQNDEAQRDVELFPEGLFPNFSNIDNFINSIRQKRLQRLDQKPSDESDENVSEERTSKLQRYRKEFDDVKYHDLENIYSVPNLPQCVEDFVESLYECTDIQKKSVPNNHEQDNMKEYDICIEEAIINLINCDEEIKSHALSLQDAYGVPFHLYGGTINVNIENFEENKYY